MKKRFSIGEIAKLFSINISTLRHYNAKGLFMPDYVDPNSQYRYYSIEQFETLSIIQYLRASEMPINDVKAFLSTKNLRHTELAIKDQLVSIQQKITMYQAIERELTTILEQLKNARSIDQPTIEWFDERSYTSLNIKEISNESIDYNLQVLSKDTNSVFTGRYGLILPQASFSSSNYDQRHLFLLSSSGESIMPQGYYLVYRFNGGHRDAFQAYRSLQVIIKDNHYVIDSDFYEVTLINDAYSNERSDYVTEINVKLANNNLSI